MDAPVSLRALLPFFVVLAACSGARTHRVASADAGTTPNDSATPAPDAATTADAGTRVDAGGARDAAALPFDAGTDAGPSGVAAHVEIYSGNGQMVLAGFPSGDRMKVRVTDAAGRPVSGESVTWTVTVGGMAVTGDTFSTGTTGTTGTDANGIARAGLRGEFLSTLESGVPAQITATCSAGTVTFHAVSTYYPTGFPTMPTAYVTTPDSHDLGMQAHDTVLAGGVVAVVAYQAGAEMGRGAAGIGVRFLPSEDPNGDAAPVVSCANATEGLAAGGTVFTDASGMATCDLRVPSTPGDYSLAIRIGGAVDFTPYVLHVI